ncbi:unnamed protein product [Trichobilharzia regenti]|nr:unnamed protein product [Trichobilharzia regenti]
MDNEDIKKLIEMPDVSLKYSLGEFLNEHHRVLEKRLEPVLRDVIDSKAKMREELEATYRNIISALLLQSGLGSPTNMEVVRETTAALQSVFPQTDIANFLSANPGQKRKRLYELTGLVTGIRLYNKDCNKGGAGIDDRLFLKLSAVDPTSGVLSSANIAAEAAKEIDITPNQLRAAVVNARQYGKFLRIIEKELNKMLTGLEKMVDSFKGCMKRLHTLISDRPAVPSSEVYPGFLQLANCWTSFQDEMVFLSVLTSTLNTLQTYFVGRRLKWTKEKLCTLISDSEITYDENRKVS